MGKVTRVFTKKEISQTREEKEREREKEGERERKGRNTNEDDEGYLPASQDVAPTVVHGSYGFMV